MMDSAFRNTMIIGVFAYGALGLLALVMGSIMVGDKLAMLAGIAAFGASYGSQLAGALGYRQANLALMALALVLACGAFAHLLLI